MKEVTDHTDRDTGMGYVGETHGTTETLIFFGVVITQLDLQVTTLVELTSFAIGNHLTDELLHLLRGDLTNDIGIGTYLIDFDLL